jgi:hypothetical protein
MSYSEENSNQNTSEELESAQKNQKKVGPAENLREEAAQNTGKDDSQEPA